MFRFNEHFQKDEKADLTGGQLLSFTSNLRSLKTSQIHSSQL